MLKVFLLAISALLLPLCTAAQSRFLSSPEEVRRVAEGIVASAAAGNYSGAFKELRPLSVIPATDFDVFEAQFNSQAANLLRQFGAATGYEFHREDKFGTHMLRTQFIVFHEKTAMRWNIIFYKAEKGWVISHFNFDANALTFFPNGS